MKSKLDQEKTYLKFDKEEISYGIDHMPEQFHEVHEQALKLNLKGDYKNIVVFGMGGSHLAPRMVKAVLSGELEVPFEIISDYNVPAYVGEGSLVILSSFSGSTEEVLEAAHKVMKTSAKVVVICTGGPLAEISKNNDLPLVQFEPGDLAAQPRLGVGFSFAGTIGILEAAGLADFGTKKLQQMTVAMADVIAGSHLEIPADENPAKIVAEELNGRAILIVAAEHLIPNAHILQNQIDETAKQFALHLELPEINHHFLEALTFPKKFFNKFTVLMMRSNLYHQRTQKRFDITAEILEKQGGQVIDYELQGKTVHEEAAEALQFGSYVSYYMGMLNGVEPQFIPFVKELKKKMSE